jgi:formate-nitrite transporter family protein
VNLAQTQQPTDRAPEARAGTDGSGGGTPNLEQSAVAVADQAEPLRPYRQILTNQIKTGLSELQRPTSGLLLSAFSGGLDVGFSLFLMAVILTLTGGVFPQPLVDILVANMYAVGFIFVILGRSELFTEHTALAVVPVLNRRATVGQLGRLWILVFTANIMGGALFAAIATQIGPALGVIRPEAFGQIARGVVSHPWFVILGSAVLAGWLMGLVGWLVSASRDTISQVVLVWLVTTAIGISHLHHSIVGTIEVLAGIFAGQGITPADFGKFLLWTTLGNIIGGTIMVALLKYGHVMQSNADAPDVSLNDSA